jgi:hypothetical protein
MLALMDEPVDTSEIPEHKGPLRPIKRDAEGRLPEPLPELRDSPIRLAILVQLGRLALNRYQLWKKAQAYCPRIPRSAVYEYLRGQRPIGTPYVEALISAAGLGVGPVGAKVRPLLVAPGRPGARAAAMQQPQGSAAMMSKDSKVAARTVARKPAKDRRD